MASTADISTQELATPAQQSQSSNYTQGHSNYTVATHQSRTAEVDAAFLLPHIKSEDHILDVGCGPGTITTGLAKYASKGTTTGIDISKDVLQKAKTLAAKANVPTQGPGSVVFKHGNVLERLAYADDTFDIVFASQLFGHLPSPDLPRRALAELRRVLKPGGILATRDGAAQHFYPRSLDLDRLWVRNQGRGLSKGTPEADPTETIMPALLRGVGFDADGGKVRIGAGTTVYQGPETRKFLAWRAVGQLKQGDAFHQSWLDAGITEDEIQQTLAAVEKWAKTEDAWYAALQCEMLAWK
jgi:ubiquinone/menaquinone biosynthesis C-methylase UbiE